MLHDLDQAQKSNAIQKTNNTLSGGLFFLEDDTAKKEILGEESKEKKNFQNYQPTKRPKP